MRGDDDAGAETEEGEEEAGGEKVVVGAERLAGMAVVERCLVDGREGAKPPELALAEEVVGVGKDGGGGGGGRGGGGGGGGRGGGADGEEGG